jgi:hypothetical protein
VLHEKRWRLPSMPPTFSLLFSLCQHPLGSPLANPHRFLHPELEEDDDIAEALPERVQDSLDHTIARGPLLLHRR